MLEAVFTQLVEKLFYGLDTGLTVEIRDFFRENKDVINYELKVIEGKKYKIHIKLNQYSNQEAKKIFLRFLSFIEYSGASFYMRKDNPECIEYLLLSVTDDNKLGLYCQMIFQQSQGTLCQERG